MGGELFRTMVMMANKCTTPDPFNLGCIISPSPHKISISGETGRIVNNFDDQALNFYLQLVILAFDNISNVFAIHTIFDDSVIRITVTVQYPIVQNYPHFITGGTGKYVISNMPEPPTHVLIYVRD